MSPSPPVQARGRLSPSPIKGEGICGFTLTLGPPLNLPLGGGGRWLEGEGVMDWIGGVLCFSLGSRLRGNDVGLFTLTLTLSHRGRGDGCCGRGCCADL